MLHQFADSALTLFGLRDSNGWTNGPKWGISPPGGSSDTQVNALANLANTIASDKLPTYARGWEYGGIHAEQILAAGELIWRFFSSGETSIIINCASTTLQTAPAAEHVRAAIVVAKDFFTVLPKSATFARKVFAAQPRRRFLIVLAFDHEGNFVYVKYGRGGSGVQSVTYAWESPEGVDALVRVLAGVGMAEDVWCGAEVDEEPSVTPPSPYLALGRFVPLPKPGRPLLRLPFPFIPATTARDDENDNSLTPASSSCDCLDCTSANSPTSSLSSLDLDWNFIPGPRPPIYLRHSCARG